MNLTENQRQLIADIDKTMQVFMQYGFSETRAISLLKKHLPAIKTLLHSVDSKLLDLYLQGYQGFNRFVTRVG
ncbi:hypothetical protein [Legionella fairfieldensis]|uniref:hypothetical protein n=1 Tax=Legionella fairfieldensis TaxID=45064 RepID=UPI00048CA3E9|nr:hypothetical protein [Legionella fairfieldensis]